MSSLFTLVRTTTVKIQLVARYVGVVIGCGRARQTMLTLYFAFTLAPRQEHKEIQKRKDILVEALARKARAYCDLAPTEDSAADFEATLKELKEWIDIDSDKKYAVLVLEREKRAKRFGSVLKLLNALIKNNGDDTKGGPAREGPPPPTNFSSFGPVR